MSDFNIQIKEDIEWIQDNYITVDSNLDKDEYAFNYWVLSRLYSIDEELIPSLVTEYNDKTIDCYVHFEDTKELFIIQNKYYDTSTHVTRSCVSDFIGTSLTMLANNKYKRSADLQKIFNNIKNDTDYKIWLHYYVTNNHKGDDIDTLVNSFSVEQHDIDAFVGIKFNTLDDIKQLYYDDRFTSKVDFVAELHTKVSATSLDVRPNEDAYGLKWMIELRYILINVFDIYKIYKDAVKKNYEIFEANVREYLGTKGINNGIIKTLKSKDDRENFFYYNNGITIICEKLETLRSGKISGSDNSYGVKLKNPQIVNGCQTVNSIAEVLSYYSEDDIKKEFEKSFVLVKIFQFDEKTKSDKPKLDTNIVKYTNSQNGINDKAFASKKDYFKNIQTEIRKRGMLLLVKPSDKNTFNDDLKDKFLLSELQKKSKSKFDVVGLDNSKASSLYIPLEKLLKVLLAFCQDGAVAFKKGGNVLKPNSVLYKEFSLTISDQFTNENILNMYLWYMRSEMDKKNGDKRHPIAYYIFSFFGIIFKDKNYEEVNKKLRELFNDKELFEEIHKFYIALITIYVDKYYSKHDADYNLMIKQPIDYSIVDECIKSLTTYGCPEIVLKYLEFKN